MAPKLSIIILTSGEYHLENLKTLLHILGRQTYQNFEIIVVEQDTELFKSSLPLFKSSLPIVYIPVENPLNNLFCRSWLFNVGANHAKDRKFLFLDADVVFDDLYLQAVNDFNKPWFVAWNQLYYMNGPDSDVVRKRKSIQSRKLSAEGVWPSLVGACGGATCVDREFFYDKWGGWNESIMGWGSDDNDAGTRAKSILGKLYTLSYQVFHLQHRNKKYHGHSSQNNLHHWWITQHHPQAVTEKLLRANLGQLSGPTMIDVSDLES